MSTQVTESTLNGINVEALRNAIDAISNDPALGRTKWQVSTEWKGGTRNDTRVSRYMIGGETVEKDFLISIDEPLELCGTNEFANPQEYLQAAMNSCIMVGYAAACALEGIHLRSLRLETEGEIDLRGFLGIDPEVKPGYESLRYTVHIQADATPEELEKVHAFVSRTAPNRFNLATAIPVETRLVIES